LVDKLNNLQAIYNTLHQLRQTRGALDFDTVETQILFNTNGKIESIRPTERNEAHKIIEECMLAANVCAAKYLLRHKKPTLYRVHQGPPPEKLTALRAFLAELGLSLQGGKEPTPSDYRAVLAEIKGRADENMIQTVLLRSLSQAVYSPDSHGHFGLAYTAYLHFTSPIRRYPDLLVHRGIKEVLMGKFNLELVLQPEEEAAWSALAEHCSGTERRSDEATRFATSALKCEYMKDKVGEIYEGRITGVAAFGLFVELKSVFIEGMIHITRIGDEYFHFEASKHRLIGEHTRKVYRLGDLIQVQVARVDTMDQKIDLELIN
jgi:ribonuclease R